MPVLTQLHRDAGGLAVSVTKKRGNAGNGRADFLQDSASRFFEHEAGDLLFVGRVGKLQTDLFKRIVGRVLHRGRRSRHDAVEIDPIPSGNGFEFCRSKFSCSGVGGLNDDFPGWCRFFECVRLNGQGNGFPFFGVL